MQWSSPQNIESLCILHLVHEQDEERPNQRANWQEVSWFDDRECHCDERPSYHNPDVEIGSKPIEFISTCRQMNFFSTGS